VPNALIQSTPSGLEGLGQNARAGPERIAMNTLRTHGTVSPNLRYSFDRTGRFIEVDPWDGEARTRLDEGRWTVTLAEGGS
jgi:hypothetical protein